MKNQKDDQILNLEMIESLRKLDDGSDNLVRELVRIWRSDYPVRICELKAALNQVNRIGIAHSVHQIKSSSANLGGLRVALVAREIEDLADILPLIELAQLIEKLEVHIDEFNPVLKRVIS